MAIGLETVKWQIFKEINVAAGENRTINNCAMVEGDITVAAGGSLTINGDGQVIGDLTVAASATVTVNGFLSVMGDIINDGACYIKRNLKVGVDFTSSSTFWVYGNVEISRNLTGQIWVEGNCWVNWSVDTNDTWITIQKDCYIAGDLTLGNYHTDKNSFYVYGNLQIDGSINNNGGWVTIEGDCIVLQDMICTDSAVG